MLTFLSFYFEQLQSGRLAVQGLLFRVAKLPFISTFCVGFETQLMETSKIVRTVSK